MGLYTSRFTINGRFGGLYSSRGYIRAGVILGLLQYFSFTLRLYVVVVLLQANLGQLKSELDYMSEETEEGRAHIQRIKGLIDEKTKTLHQRLETDIFGHSVPLNGAMRFPSTESDTRRAPEMTAPVAESVADCDGRCKDPVVQKFKSISRQSSVIASEFETMFPPELEGIFKGTPLSANSKGSVLHGNLLSQQVRKLTQQSFVKRPRLIVL